ncbi:MAG: RHS repeat-associated core domain-containing protein [Alteromonadaceae bacterium]|nr:RHS repeat-associated core domain-containing protein [Alteromonadaceae bacterium]
MIATTDVTGKVISQAIYDPYGKRSEVYLDSLLANYSKLSPTDRGYTGHKHIEALDIIHMNGRIYDPTLGRFLQADPIIQAPTDSQSYNRYAYVRNNPLSLTDPSGYSWLSKAWKKVKQYAAVIVGAALIYFTGGAASPFVASWYGAAAAGAISGAVGAAANGGNILTGALRGAFSAAAFYGVGSAFSEAACASCFSGGELTAAATAGKIAAHAITGGVMSVMQGGKFGHGFVAAGVTQGFAKSIDGISSARFSLGRIAAAAVIGGTVSKLTGGKFANGATTGAFSRMFNDEANHQINNKKYGKGYTNPVTKELQYASMEGYTPRWRDGQWALGVDGNIMFFPQGAQMDMGVYGYDSAVTLQCQAMNDCTGEYQAPTPSNYSKPKISANSSPLKVNLVGNGWYFSKSIPSIAISAAGRYHTTVSCGNNVDVVIQCGGGG